MLTAGSATGRLLILKEGAVEVVKEGVQIANVTEPGAVFANSPCCWISHTPRTCAGNLAASRRRRGRPARARPDRTPHVAAILAQRLDGANHAHRGEAPASAGRPHSVIGKTVEELEGLLGANGASLVYADYPPPKGQ